MPTTVSPRGWFTPSEEPAALLDEQFTGTNGDPWSSTNWSSPPAEATIQNNRGQITTPAAAYNNTSVQVNPSALSVADFDVVMEVDFADKSEYLCNIHFRWAITGGQRMGTLYRHQTGSWNVNTHDGTTETELDSGVIGGTTTADTMRMRLRAVGSSVSFKIWRSVNSEPGTWLTTVTDSSHTARTGQRLFILNGAVATAKTVDVNYITWSAP